MKDYDYSLNSFDIAKKLLGDKWKYNIICHLFNGPLYYGELLSTVDSISKKVLTENLRELERLLIITKTNQKDGNVEKVLYSLTEIGTTLKPVFNNVIEWSLQYSKIQRENSLEKEEKTY